jgi:hypothetical protein
VEGRDRGGDGILSVAAVWGAHTVETSNSVSRMELVDLGPDGVHDAGYVVAFVTTSRREEVWELPVFRVRGGGDDFDAEFFWAWGWDGNIFGYSLYWIEG